MNCSAGEVFNPSVENILERYIQILCSNKQGEDIPSSVPLLRAIVFRFWPCPRCDDSFSHLGNSMSVLSIFKIVFFDIISFNLFA